MTYGGTGSHVFDPHALLGEFLGSKGRVGLEMVELGVNFIQSENCIGIPRFAGLPPTKDTKKIEISKYNQFSSAKAS